MTRNDLVRSILLALALSSGAVGCTDEARPDGPTADTEVPSSWLATVHSSIATSEYQVQAASEGLRATNRSQGFRVAWRDDGEVTVRARGGSAVLSESVHPWELRLRTEAWGRQGALSPLGGVPELGECADPDILDVHGRCLRGVALRSGQVVESWENRPDGLEVRWLVDAAPVGAGDLLLVLEADGLEVEVDEEAVRFAGAGHLRLDGLRAWDAAGRGLEARFVHAAGGFAVRVVDEGAAYPVRIDPLLTTVAWTADPTNQAHAMFGYSVASAGDLDGDGFGDVIVGAESFNDGEMNEGRAFVFNGSSSGLSTVASWAVSPTNQAESHFGSAVATAGDTNGDGFSDVVVGAPTYDGTSGSNAGAAFLYLGSATGLGTAADWTAEGLLDDSWFGGSVGSAGDTNGDGFSDVVVGSHEFDGSLTDAGRADVFFGSATGPGVSPDWSVLGDQTGASLGWSVATAGDVDGDGYSDVVIGAPYYDDGHSNEGRTYLYLGSTSGPNAAPNWTAESDQTGALFGAAVGPAGDVDGDGYSDLLVGAYYYDGIAGIESGRAYLFPGTASGLQSTPSWTVESSQSGAILGFSVATAGDVNGDGWADFVVGAPH